MQPILLSDHTTTCSILADYITATPDSLAFQTLSATQASVSATSFSSSALKSDTANTSSRNMFTLLCWRDTCCLRCTKYHLLETTALHCEAVPEALTYETSLCIRPPTLRQPLHDPRDDHIHFESM